METETMTDAQRVAADHAGTLAAFGEWIDAFGDGASRDDVDLAGSRAGWRVSRDDDEGIYGMARECLAWFDDTGADGLSWSAFMDGALDVEISGRFDGRDGWEITGVALLVTCGGPNVRYHVHGSGTIRVSVTWWNDHADRVIDSGLADYLDQYANEVVAS